MSLHIFFFDRIHDVVVADHRAGDHHGGEDDRQDADDAGQDRPPRQAEGKATHPAELVVDEHAQGDPERQTIQQGGQPIEQALVAQHAPKSTRRQPDRFEHGDLAPAQLDVGIQGVDDVGYPDQRDQRQEPVEEQVDQQRPQMAAVVEVIHR